MAFAALGQIPSEMFATKATFVQLLQDSWTLFDEAKRTELLNRFLPNTLSTVDKNETVQQLLNNELLRFDDNPVDTIFIQLKLQRLAPDIAKTLDDVRQLKQKAKKLKEDEYQMNIWKEVTAKRHCLLNNALYLSADEPLSNISKLKRHNFKKTKHSLPSWNPMQCLTPANELIKTKRYCKVRQRYMLEMKRLADEDELLNLSSDDSDDSILSLPARTDNGYIPMSSKKLGLKSTKSNNLSNGLKLSEEKYFNLLKNYKRKRKAIDSAARPPDPFMDTSNITIYDIINRVTKVVPSDDELSTRSLSPPPKSIKSTNNTSSKKSLNANKKKPPPSLKILPQPSISVLPDPPESIKEESSASVPDSSIFTTVNSTMLNNNNIDCSRIKKESLDVFEFEDSPSDDSSTVKPLSLPSSVINSQIITTSSTAAPSSPASSSFFKHPSSESGQITPLEVAPSCFFALLRDIFLSHAPNDHKLTLHRLEELVKEKLRNFDPNAIGWSHEMVQSAMNFLSGALPPPDMIPLVDYKEKNQQWQWIGMGRDSDKVLLSLNEEWTNEKDKNSSSSLMDPNQPVPPPIYPTEWTVCPSTEDERKLYRTQEAIRYNNPHKAYTFKLHSYQSVVGPVKGCGTGSSNVHAASPNKAREHSLLVSERPPFVTLLSLVRDAAARLPNGEGTRADICELLKDSQYLLPTVSDPQVNGIVSGALDRLHYEKDPCVKYDVNRKVWIYLHRNRSEQEFERLHEMQVAAAKAKRNLSKNLSKSQRRSSASRTPTTSITITTTAITSTTNKSITKVAKPQNILSNALTNSETVVSTSPSQPIVTSSTSQPTVTVRHSISHANAHPIHNQSTIASAFVTTVSATNPNNINRQTIATTKDLTANSTGTSNDQQTKRIVQTNQQTLAAMLKKKPPTKTFKVIKKDDTNNVSIQISSANSIIDTPTTVLPATAITIPAQSEISTVKFIKDKPTTITRQVVANRISQVKPNMSIVPQKTPVYHNVQTEAIQIQPTTTTNVNQTVPANITLGAKTVVLDKQQLSQVVAKQIQLPISQNQTQASITSTVGGTQISIPSNVFFSGRPTSVVLATPTGKSYMMATTGTASYVLQPQNTVTAGNSTTTVVTTTGQQSSGTQLAMRTLQGIKVIPVQNAQRPAGTIIANQTQQATGTTVPSQLVARIISGRGGVQPTQIVIPNSGFGVQPVIAAQQGATQQNQPSPNQISLQPSSQIAISVQPHKVTQPQVTTVTLPIQSQQKR